MRLPLFAALALLTIPAHAAVVGTNPPSQPITLARIATLPASEQAAWRAYLERSTRLQAADRASLAAERKGMNPAEVRLPPHGRTGSVMPLNRPADWYASADAQRRADNLITFQLPSGGWSKNFDPVDHPRTRGEGYSPENTSKFLAPGDNDQPQDIHWSYLGTFDNDATTTELHFLAKAIHAADATRSKAWRAAFDRGLDYILAAQFPHGGWPQVYPLEGGYHDAITYNDDAMTNLLTFLQDIADGREAFAFVAADQRVRAAKAIQRGLDCLLATQIRVGSRRTVWGQQHDALTLESVSARNYEMPSQASSESAGTVLYLMAQTNPSPPSSPPCTLPSRGSSKRKSTAWRSGRRPTVLAASCCPPPTLDRSGPATTRSAAIAHSSATATNPSTTTSLKSPRNAATAIRGTAIALFACWKPTRLGPKTIRGRTTDPVDILNEQAG
jgi:PelA/Pel-15E family pectate lyase